MVEKITMNADDTLELDYLVEQVSDDAIGVADEPDNVSTSINYISTRTGVFNPPDTGTYQLNIDGQIIEIEVIDIPDTSMFQNAIYQFYIGSYGGGVDGDTSIQFPEVLAGLSGATPTGNPTYDADYDATGVQMSVYDGDDYHSWSSDNSLPTGSDAKLAIFATYYITSTSGTQTVAGYGDLSVSVDSGEYEATLDDTENLVGGSPPTNTIDTLGFSHDGSTGSSELFGGGSSIRTGNVNLSPTDKNGTIAYNDAFDDFNLTGGVFEVVVCDGTESSSNYQTYHSDRTP